MNFINQAVQKVHYYNTQRDWDTFHVVGGDEGRGKSNLMLWLVHKYLELLRSQVTEEDVKHVAQDHDSFKKVVQSVKKFEPLANDEAGDITGRRAMSKFNVQMTNTYKVIRGDNNYTIMLTPTVFDLEPYFLKHRCKGLWFVYKRGRVAFFTQSKLRKMIALNQGRYLKSVWAVQPDFIDKFPIYKGPLREPYDQQKQEGMKRKKQDMMKELDNEKSPEEIERRVKSEIVLHAKEQGYTNSELANLLNCSTRTITSWAKIAQEARSEQET